TAAGCAEQRERHRDRDPLWVRHLGRFAIHYRRRYGESPSLTLCRTQKTFVGNRLPPVPPSLALSRPTIAVLPFQLIGHDACRAEGIREEIAGALLRLRWIRVVQSNRAQYRLRGKIYGDGLGALRITALLLDSATGRYVWADRCEGDDGDLFAFQERTAERIA